MRIVDGPERYAVVSCHVERPLDDRVWRAFARLLERRPGGFAVTPLLRPPHAASGEAEGPWVERARWAAELAPLGHHTHWGGPAHARPPDGVDAAADVRREAEWLRARGLEPRFFCGGGWYIDEPVAEVLAGFDYVDCTATTFRQAYLADGAPCLRLPGPRRVALGSGVALLELPATHSVGMLARGLRALPDAVHVHFHDWELVDRPRAAAIRALIRLLALRRTPLTVAELAARAAAAPEIAWREATIAR
jgi:hypothetical protein